ncbi:MAG: ATPase, T2SS/T4P/T4SS family [Candidatus Omnitrophota bacterium]
MEKKFDPILSKALIKKKLLEAEVVEAALRESLTANEALATILLKKELLSEEKILKVLAEELKIPYLRLSETEIEKQVIEKIPVKFAGYYKFMPIKLAGRVLTIACGYPLELKVQDDVRMSLGYDIEVVLARQNDIVEALKRHYGLGADTIEKILEHTPAEQITAHDATEEKIEDIEKLAEDASVIRLVNQIILEAYKKRASDIHLEPYRGRIKLRYRIDGVLYNANVPPEISSFFSPILSRIKIMSNLNIVEHRLPQDGRAVVKIQDQTLDLRVSFIPTPYGESVVVRILPMKMLFSLEKLGLLPEDQPIFEDLIKRPHGIIFVTGPTGSGKSTTLYACLSKINTDERKIITIEDPIEYELEGVTQLQVLPKIGLTFARGLRSMLRHDPDVMMVGEVRDTETAEIAIRVALTGHLVFSTVHTNDAASGIMRLIDIGIEPYLVASSVEALIGQRLIRVICPACKELDLATLTPIRQQIAQDLRLSSIDEVKIYRAKGCEKCNFTGFYGRTAIYEILLIDDEIRSLVTRKAPAEEINKKALEKGMLTMRQNGWKKVLSGVTTPDEVMKVTQAEPALKAELADKAEKDEDAQSARRDFPRLDIRIPLRYRVVRADESKGAPAEERACVSENVSAGGLVFLSAEPLFLGTVLEIKIDLPAEDKPIQCLCRVLRVEEIIIDRSYDVAVCFLDISGAERTRFNKFVQDQLKRPAKEK